MTGESERAAPGLADDCPCPKRDCDRLGNCVECVRVHRQDQNHLPACLQPMLRDLIGHLAGKIECRLAEGQH